MNKKYLYVILFLCLPIFSYENGQLIEVGTKKATELPFRDPSDRKSAASNLEPINARYHAGKGNIASVFNYGPNLVKMIPKEQFLSVDEINANKVAGDIGVGPRFFDAWVTHQKNEPDKLYVVIEMEKLEGVTLSSVIPRNTRNKDERELKELQNLYKNRNTKYKDGNTYFFDRLFSILKMLAENKISWTDAHYGNFIHPDGRVSFGGELKIIDFDSSKLHESVSDAAKAILVAPYIKVWTDMFDKLPENYKGKTATEALDFLRQMAQID